MFTKSALGPCLCTEVVFSVGILSASKISLNSSDYDLLLIAIKIYWKPYQVSGPGAKHFTSVI